MHNLGGWRMWRPKHAIQHSVDCEAQDIARVGDIFERVEDRIKKLNIARGSQRGQTGFEQLAPIIQSAKDHAYRLENERAAGESRAEAWLYALILQAPRAAEAQQEMDKHPQGYHNKEKRLYELIDFNDAFVSAVLSLPEVHLPHFAEKTKLLADKFCNNVGSRCLSNDQFEAIVHGLSREIAVYRAVKREGFEAEMTNRATDAFGIDMRIIDPVSLKSVNIDVKTHSAYRYRVQDLQREGRLSEEELMIADRRGFTSVYNGRGEQKVRVVIWRIDHVALGGVRDFSFTNTKPIGDMMREIILFYGEKP